MPTTEKMISSAAHIAFVHLERDLTAAALDADRYAVSVMDMFAQQPPSAFLVGCPARLALLEERLASLLGCLAMGRRTIAKLKELGV